MTYSRLITTLLKRTIITTVCMHNSTSVYVCYIVEHIGGIQIHSQRKTIKATHLMIIDSACVGFGSGSACSDSPSHGYGPTSSAHSVW